MNGNNQTYGKYLAENDQFFYDENSSKGSFLKQDSELFNDDEASIPGKSFQVKFKKDDWNIFVDGDEYLVLKGSRFTNEERKFLLTVDGIQFILNGVKQGWKSVSEFKRQLKDKV